MNKKIDEEFKGIKDIYFLQCKCTEMKKAIRRLIKTETIQMEMINDLFDEIIYFRNKFNLINEIVEKELPPNEFITRRIKKILKVEKND